MEGRKRTQYWACKKCGRDDKLVAVRTAQYVHEFVEVVDGREVTIEDKGCYEFCTVRKCVGEEFLVVCVVNGTLNGEPISIRPSAEQIHRGLAMNGHRWLQQDCETIETYCGYCGETEIEYVGGDS